MNAIINPEQSQNYTVGTLDKKIDIGTQKFKARQSDYIKFCGFGEFLDPEVEIMDIVNKRLQSISQSSCKVEKESELVGMLSKQLYLAGNQMQRMQAVLKKAEERLKTKDQEIGKLKRKIREWEVKNRNQESIYKREIQKRQQQIENVEAVQRKCTKLETKVCEMEKFLADYGLVWVGDNRSRASRKTPEVANDFIGNCYPRLMSNIQELNMSVGKDEMQVHHSQGGASFKSPSCLNLKFYKNGMIIKKGDLRPYTDAKTRSFIQDILDGYFPSELQRDYPNGVPFKVEDHKMEMYLGEGAGYPGQGYQLGKVTRISSMGSFKAKGRMSTPKRAQTPKEKINSNTSLSRQSFSARGSNHETAIGGLQRPSSARTPDVDLFDLRSQILASHNNNCSDVHLQSHMNAELAFTSRSEKKSPLIASTPDCNFPLQSDEPLKNPRLNSSYRSSFHVSPSGRGDTRARARSASASGSRFQGRPVSRSNREPSTGTQKNSKNPAKNRVRGSKSATIEKPKSESPIIRQLNSPTGAPDELQLKVRSQNGGTVYLVHISSDDTVSRLYQLLDKAVSATRKRQKASYKIVISGYAPRRLDHMGVSLRDYGICRNCVLHLIND